jgi:hypothetical protein
LTRAIRDDAILVDGYTSAEPFFTTDLGSQNGDEGPLEAGMAHAARLSEVVLDQERLGLQLHIPDQQAPS